MRDRRTIARVAVLVTACALVLLPQPAPSAEIHPARIDQGVRERVAADAARIGVILHYADAPTEADGLKLLAAGFEPGMIRYRVVPAVYAVGPPSAVLAAASEDRITYIEHDAVIPWALDRAAVAGRARQIWDASYRLSGVIHDDGITGRGVGIAIVDTGVDATHPDLLWGPLAAVTGLEPKTAANFKIQGRDSAGFAESLGLGPFLEADQLAADVPHSDNTGGHGTHVAGIAAGNGFASGGKYTGAAPGAHLIGYGAGETLVIHMGLAALDHIHQHHAELGIRVVNNSWGGAGDWDPDSAVTKAIRRLAISDGLVMVFAAGNSGGDGSSIQSSLWGNIPETIQVANYYDRSGWLDGTSSRGRGDLPHTWPDVAAPGTQVIATAAAGGPVSYYGSAQDALLAELLGYDEPWVVPAPVPVTAEQDVGGQDVVVGNYASLTGTSMAAPFVAGVTALMLEANPDLEWHEVRDILRETANMPPGRSFETDGFAVGRGVVDAAEAVAVALRRAEEGSVADAVRTAYVDTSDPDRYALNLTEPRRVDITAPEPGDLVRNKVRVQARFSPGPLTDDTIPLAPEVSDPEPAGEEEAQVEAQVEAQTTDAEPSGVIFEEGFEDGAEGWTVSQDGVGPGLLTEWRRIDENAIVSAFGSNTGSAWFQAGLAPGTPFVSGIYYSDFADTTLVSPPIDLSGVGGAAVVYHRAGSSEQDFDLFEAYVEPEGGAPVLLEQLSGDLLFGGTTFWQPSPIFDLSAFAGQTVRLRFRFTSDAFTFGYNLAGWSLDDILVFETTPGISFTASPDHGLGSLTTTFTFGHGDADAFRLDFGDGSLHEAGEPGSVEHTYTEPGQYAATLQALDATGGVLDEADLLVDVAPVDLVQARLAWTDETGESRGTPWVDMHPHPHGLRATIDLTGVPDGDAIIEARHFGDDGRSIGHAVAVTVRRPGPA